MDIFRGRYVHATEAALVSFIIFLVAVIFIPGVGPSHEVEIILTISTFLFAILAGFFISRLSTRYNTVREIVAEEDARFISIYRTAKIYGKSFAERMRKLINNYYIKAYDRIFYSGEFNQRYFMKMWEELRKQKKHKSDSVYEVLLEDMTELERIRNTTSSIVEERLGHGKWAVLIFLSGIILFSIFYLKTMEIYSQVITVMLSTVLALVIFIIRDLQNFMFGGKILLEESGEKVMEAIGEKRYYNKYLIDIGVSRVPNNIREYRLGLHHPDSYNFDIKLVRNEKYKKRGSRRWDQM